MAEPSFWFLKELNGRFF